MSHFITFVSFSAFFLVVSCKDNYLCKVIDENYKEYQFKCNDTKFKDDPSISISNKNDIYQAINLKFDECDYGCYEIILDKAQHLQSLDVSYCQIDSLNGLIFKNPYLGKFNASHNKLRLIPDNFFTGLTNLRTVDFSYNRLKIIGHGFNVASKLTTIYLSHNYYDQITVN